MAGMKVAAIQMNSKADRAANLAQAAELLARARKMGARLAVLPEHFSFMQAEGRRPPAPEPLRGPLVRWLGEQARTLGMWIIGGSFSQQVRGRRRVYNTCPVLDDQGRLRAWYQKVHLFDLALPGRPALMESAHVLPGRRIVTVDTPAGRVGLSICYDLRFPEFYRRLRLRGAEVLVAPSAFTAATGKAHWDLLVRTRAVENACYLVAAAQWGNHGGRRKSFGRAMIVDPWGEVLAVCEDGVGVAVAEVSRRRLERLRGLLDSTGHARLLPRSWYAKGGSPR